MSVHKSITEPLRPTSRSFFLISLDCKSVEQILIVSILNIISILLYKYAISIGRNGVECQYVFVTFQNPENLNEFMKNRPLSIHGEVIRVTRSLPKFVFLSSRSVHGIKIKIHGDSNGEGNGRKLNESDLRNYFRDFGTILACHWTTSDRTEALFTFQEY